LEALSKVVADLTEAQAQSSVDEVRASVALARGDLTEALQAARQSYRRYVAPDSTSHITAGRAAAWLGDAAGVKEALGVLQEQHGRVNDAAGREARAALAILESRRDDGLAGFLDAIRRWQDLDFEFEAAMCALNLVTILGPTSPEARAAGEWAAGLFERVGAEPFARRLTGAMHVATPAAATDRDASIVTDPRATMSRAE
jgi:hypothetical protein